MTDIVEYVEQKFRSGNSVPIERAWLTAGEWAQVRAEIVRLRGEVSQVRDQLAIARQCRDAALELARISAETNDALATIAPAEAKGDFDKAVEWIASDPYFTVEGAHKAFAPQPADGGAVAWQLIDTKGKPAFLPYLRKEEAEGMVTFYQDDSQLRKQDQEVFTIRPLYTHPPTAQVQGGATALLVRDLRHAERMAEKVGLEEAAFLHRRAADALAAHHSACELGASEDAWQRFAKALNLDLTEPSSTAKAHGATARYLYQNTNDHWLAWRAALQHRGDSRGGEG